MDNNKINLSSKDCDYISPETMEFINKFNFILETSISTASIEVIIRILIGIGLISDRDSFDSAVKEILNNSEEYKNALRQKELIMEIIDIDKKINLQKNIKRNNTVGIRFDDADYDKVFTDELTAYKNSLLRRYSDLTNDNESNRKITNVKSIVVP